MQKQLLLILAISALCYANRLYQCTAEDRARNFVCTRELDPVCGVQVSAEGNGQLRVDYGNLCMACSDVKVRFVSRGECNTIPQDARVCDPSRQGNYACPKILRPVCAYPDPELVRCYEGCWFDHNNECEACADPNIWYYKLGKCPFNPWASQ